MRLGSPESDFELGCSDGNIVDCTLVDFTLLEVFRGRQ